MNTYNDKIIYQIYVKSFMDTTGNGHGDINGITRRLDYLEDLGVDYLWLTPVFVSPMNDNGYDVADYKKIDPVFGTMDDLTELITKAKDKGLGIMLDMVFNHSSTSHEWFQKALAGNQKYQDYYIFKEGKDNKPPTNWISKFGGSAWSYVPQLGKYYLHLFDESQADLNWENPHLREELYDIVRFWMNKGIRGFRFDVVNLISKPEIYKDDFIGDGRRFYTDGPKVHTYLKELNEKTFGQMDDSITVGEMSSTDLENCILYSKPEEKELSMVFNFHHLKVDYENGDKWSLKDFDFKMLKEIFDHWQTGMQENQGTMALFYNNHDQPRVVSRFGDDQNFLDKSAKMLATSIHLLRGTPYIYQGEEFGMTNANFTSIDDYRDVESTNYYQILKENGVDDHKIMAILGSKSRDNGRTPMLWSSDEGRGFTVGVPWLPFAKVRGISQQEDQEKEDSIQGYYKQLIQLRKKEKAIQVGQYEMLEKNHESLFVYTRRYNQEQILVLNNFYENDVLFDLEKNNLPAYCEETYQILLTNTDGIKIQEGKILLQAYDAIILKF